MNECFELYDLRIELVRFENEKRMTDGAKVWDYFEVRWENIFIPAEQGFSYYNLAAIIPLLAAKQRVTNDVNDWMELDDESISVMQGDVVLIEDGVFHRVHAGPKGCYFVCVFDGRRTHWK